MRIRPESLAPLLIPGVILGSCFNYSVPFGPVLVTPQKIMALLFLGYLAMTAVADGTLLVDSTARRRMRIMSLFLLTSIGLLVLGLMKSIRFSEVGLLIPSVSHCVFCLGLWFSLAYRDRFWSGFYSPWFVYAGLAVATTVFLIQLESFSQVLTADEKLHTGMRLRGLGVVNTVNIWAQSLAVLTVILALTSKRELEPLRLAAGALLLFLIALSFSRSITFSILVFLFFYAALSSTRSMTRRVVVLATLAGLATLVVSMVSQTTISQFWSQRVIGMADDGSLQVRLSAWGLTWNLLGQAPWLGLSHSALRLLPPVENSFLFLLTYYGLTGLCLYLVAVLRWTYFQLWDRGRLAVPLIAFVFILSFANENVFNLPLLTLFFFSQTLPPSGNRLV